MFSRLMSLTILIQNPGQTSDQYGRQGADWIHPVETTVKGWFDIGMRKMAEDGHNEDSGTSDGTAFLPATLDNGDPTPVSTVTRLVIQGNTYQVFGVPTIANTPNSPHHIECRVQRFSG